MLVYRSVSPSYLLGVTGSNKQQWMKTYETTSGHYTEKKSTTGSPKTTTNIVFFTKNYFLSRESWSFKIGDCYFIIVFDLPGSTNALQRTLLLALLGLILSSQRMRITCNPPAGKLYSWTDFFYTFSTVTWGNFQEILPIYTSLSDFVLIWFYL